VRRFAGLARFAPGLVLAIGAFAWGAGRVGATSLFSTDGLGETVILATGRGRALGGVSVPIEDVLRVNLENPALAASIRRVSVSTIYLAERRTAENDAASESFSDGSFPFVSAAVPFPRTIVLGVGFLREQGAFVNPLTQARVETPAPYTLRFERDGDIFRVPLGLAFGLGKWVQLGWNYDFWFGSVEETRVVDFDAPDMRDSRDRVFDDVDGGGMSVGILAKPIPALRLGARLRGKETLTGERRITTADAETTSTTVEHVMPQSISAGATLTLGRAMLAFEMRQDSWKGEEADAPPAGGFEDALRIGGGIELLPTPDAGPFFARVPWRLGFHHAEWHFIDVDGDPITEWFVTGGTSFYMRGDAAALDLVVEYGQRGNRAENDLEESLLRVGVGFAAGEPWRKPERRRRGSSQPPPDNY
jgi:hypothetical protein